MLLNTFPFLVFFLVVFVLYWKIPGRFQWVWLLLAGYYFFGSWKPAYLGLIAVTTVINYFSALAIYASAKRKGTLLFLALAFDLGVLFLFKYFNFFAVSLDQLLPWGVHLPQFSWILPIGISFYTFQTIGYLVDVYRGKVKPERHIGYFALFVCFFPQLSAGPIERAGELLPQLRKAHVFRYDRVVSGLKLFTFGLFQKMVIADNIAVVVDRVFRLLPEYKGFSLVLVVVLFSWQIYMDFSGYTDMARGVARMLGFDLVQNFNAPYFATSVRDFWRRWHMSLSRWFGDYLYIPLGGSRRGIVLASLNTFIVFVLCGLWHGASWNFLMWGVFHGFVMAGERIAGKITNNRIRIPAFAGTLYTYGIVCISWVFFRADTVSDAGYIFRNALVGLKNVVSLHYLWASVSQLFMTNRIEMVITLGLVCLALCLDRISKRTLDRTLGRQPAIIRMAAYALLVLTIVQLRNADMKEFIYIRF